MLDLISLKTLFQCAPGSGGHPEDQAIFPADTGRVRVQGAAPGVACSCLLAWLHGVCHRGSQGL